MAVPVVPVALAAQAVMAVMAAAVHFRHTYGAAMAHLPIVHLTQAVAAQVVVVVQASLEPAASAAQVAELRAGAKAVQVARAAQAAQADRELQANLV